MCRHASALREQRLVADLDRVMTVEKSVVFSWQRTVGCPLDEDARNFARALARKRARFAFPNDFNRLVDPLSQRLKEKHDRRSPEGGALRALREIRVVVTPRGLRLKLMCFSGSSALTATNQRTVTSTLLRGWTWYRRKGVFAPSQDSWSTLRN